MKSEKTEPQAYVHGDLNTDEKVWHIHHLSKMWHIKWLQWGRILLNLAEIEVADHLSNQKNAILIPSHFHEKSLFSILFNLRAVQIKCPLKVTSRTSRNSGKKNKGTREIESQRGKASEFGYAPHFPVWAPFLFPSLFFEPLTDWVSLTTQQPLRFNRVVKS